MIIVYGGFCRAIRLCLRPHGRWERRHGRNRRVVTFSWVTLKVGLVFIGKGSFIVVMRGRRVEKLPPKELPGFISDTWSSDESVSKWILLRLGQFDKVKNDATCRRETIFSGDRCCLSSECRMQRDKSTATMSIKWFTHRQESA